MANRAYGDARLLLAAEGEMEVDRAGLWTATCMWTVPVDRLDLVPKLGSPHPRAVFLAMEKMRLKFTPGLWKIFTSYAGVQDEISEPVYELNPGVGNEPIQTHKDFVKTLAGTPRRPLNGAVFVDPQTGLVTKDDTPGKFEFSRFSVLHPKGQQNPFAGLESYLEANNTVWVKSWTRRLKPAVSGRALKIVADPPGQPGSFPGHDWLEFPPTFVKRGGAYACQQQWLLSGPKGWLKPVYS